MRPKRYSSISMLREIPKDKCEKMLKIIETENKPFKLFETYRTDKLQDYYHNRTNSSSAKAGYSYHNYGLAFDIVGYVNGKFTWDLPWEDWLWLGQLGESLGLFWGGRWKKLVDCPHFQWSDDFNSIYEFLSDPNKDSFGYYQDEDEAVKFLKKNGIITTDKDWHNSSPTWYETAVILHRLYNLDNSKK